MQVQAASLAALRHWADSDWLLRLSIAGLYDAVAGGEFRFSQLGDGLAQAVSVLLPLHVFLLLLNGWLTLEGRRAMDSRALRCGCRDRCFQQRQLEESSNVHAPAEAKVWYTLPPTVPAQPLPVSFETVDRAHQQEAFDVISGHFARMWKEYAAALFGCVSAVAGQAADGILRAPPVVWILRVHNPYCHRRYLQQLAAVANRRRLAEGRAVDDKISIAQEANEQRCFRGAVWHCGRNYNAAERIGGGFTACGHQLCTLCSMGSGSLNLDSSKSWQPLGHCHTVSAHSSRAHCEAASTHAGGLQATLMVRVALGAIHRQQDRNDTASLRHSTAAPASFDSVMADFPRGKEPHPVDDPTVAVYDSNALYASYVIVYNPNVTAA